MDNPSKPEKSKNRFWYVYGLLLIAVFGASLALRVLPMHEAVFGSGWINLQGVDGVYHLRLVENLLAHFPFRISFDPYTYFPYGQAVYFAPLFDLLAGFSAWIVGLGSPDQHTIETVAAYFTAVLGALVTLPVYFIGKTLWNRTAGLISALIIGILPGTFLFRSRLGFFDHHVAEIFFSTLAILFLLLALKNLKERPISFQDIRHKNWQLLVQPLLFSGLCGIALGFYLLAWVGGLLFVFLIFSWVVVMFIIEHLRKQPAEYLCILGLPVFLLALLIVLPYLNQIAYSELYVVSLLIALVGLVPLTAISKFLDQKNLKRFYFPLSILAIGVIGLIILKVFFPSIADSIFVKFRVFTPDNNALTISEVKPFFMSQGKFTLDRLWSEFNTGGFIAPLGFILLIVGIFRKMSSGKILLLLWTILIFVATVGQVRFAAYLAVVFALLIGYFYSEIIIWVRRFFDWLYLKPSKTIARSASHNKHRLKAQAKISAQTSNAHPVALRARWSRLTAFSLSLILVFLVGVYPNLGPAILTAGSNAGTNSDWRDSLLWMKANTPEPFQDPAYYYQLYENPSAGNYVYPQSAYGVLAWWDYGHMITQIAHRIPNSNPHQAGAVSVANYFLSQNELEANRLLDALGTRYIIIDNDIAIPFSIQMNMISGQKFYAMPTWAGTDPSQYYDVYYQQKGDKYSPVPIYYPEYYYCLVTRLYNFHGGAIVPQNSTTVISFVTQSGANVIQSSQTFSTYEEATAFLEKQTSPNFRIVGTSPYNSPVPLEKLTHYQEVYKSPSGVSYNDKITNSSYIEIFEYKP